MNIDKLIKDISNKINTSIIVETDEGGNEDFVQEKPFFRNRKEQDEYYGRKEYVKSLSDAILGVVRAKECFNKDGSTFPEANKIEKTENARRRLYFLLNTEKKPAGFACPGDVMNKIIKVSENVEAFENPEIVLLSFELRKANNLLAKKPTIGGIYGGPTRTNISTRQRVKALMDAENSGDKKRAKEAAEELDRMTRNLDKEASWADWNRFRAKKGLPPEEPSDEEKKERTASGVAKQQKMEELSSKYNLKKWDEIDTGFRTNHELIKDWIAKGKKPDDQHKIYNVGNIDGGKLKLFRIGKTASSEASYFGKYFVASQKWWASDTKPVSIAKKGTVTEPYCAYDKEDETAKKIIARYNTNNNIVTRSASIVTEGEQLDREKWVTALSRLKAAGITGRATYNGYIINFEGKTYHVNKNFVGRCPNSLLEYRNDIKIVFDGRNTGAISKVEDKSNAENNVYFKQGHIEPKYISKRAKYAKDGGNIREKYFKY